jgi:hypothetical protein
MSFITYTDWMPRADQERLVGIALKTFNLSINSYIVLMLTNGV